MRFAESRGARIYYETHGRGEPLLLIPGFGSNGTVYWANTSALARRYRVIVQDPRGSGRSDVVPGPYTMAMLAGDAAAVLDAEGVQAAHVFAASMGGMIAQHIALLHRERVRGLVLACTTPGGSHHVLPRPEQLASFMAAAEMEDPVAAVRLTYPLNYSDAYAESHDEEIVARILANEALRSTPEGRAAQLAAVQGHDTYDDLPRIGAPTLVLHGAADGIVPVANGQTIASRIPGARLRTWAQGRHVFFSELADEVNAAIADFLEALPATSAAAAPAGSIGGGDA